MPSDLTIAEVRVVLADIPVKRPHKMSFTTLEAVNFAFVRIETRGGLVGWGEAACLGGPTWSEESAESVQAVIERYVAPWLVGRDAAEIASRARALLDKTDAARRPVRLLGVSVHNLVSLEELTSEAEGLLPFE